MLRKNRRRHLRLIAAEQDVELTFSVTPAEFQQLVRIAFAESSDSVGEVVRRLVLDGLADWPARVAAER